MFQTQQKNFSMQFAIPRNTTWSVVCSDWEIHRKLCSMYLLIWCDLQIKQMIADARVYNPQLLSISNFLQKKNKQWWSLFRDVFASHIHIYYCIRRCTLSQMMYYSCKLALMPIYVNHLNMVHYSTSRWTGCLDSLKAGCFKRLCNIRFEYTCMKIYWNLYFDAKYVKCN